MVQNAIITFLLVLLTGIFSYVFGQTDPMKPVLIQGDAVTIGERSITVKTAAQIIDATLTDKTEFTKVSAADPKVKTPSSLAEIKSGDRVTLSCINAADGKSCTAVRVYVMSRSEIAAVKAKEAEEWRVRGISGKVTAFNAATREITVQMAGLTGTTTIAVSPASNAKFLRYSPESILFDDAKPSSLAEIATGDLIKAVGDRSADGTKFTAEKILTGAFRTLAGTIKSVDTVRNEVVLKDLSTGKDVVVMTTAVILFKRFPAEMAERMAGFAAGGAGGGARPVGAQPAGSPGGAPQQGNATNGAQPAGGQRPGGFGGGMRPGGGGIDDMLDRFPTITTADLKAGDIIAVSTSRSGAADRVKAFKLLAGVEPFLRMAQMTSGANRSGGVQNNLNIPGLDGIGF